MRTIFILNGLNLKLPGQREPAIYGTTTLDAIRGWCEADARDNSLVSRTAAAVMACFGALATGWRCAMAEMTK